MAAPSGFTFETRRNGDVVVHHDRRLAATLRGAAAERLLAKLDGADDPTVQHHLARATGNYRRGNERTPR